MINRIAAAFLSGVMAMTLAALPLGGADRTTPSRSDRQAGTIHSDPWRQPLTEKQKALLLLSRITFGPRPGDLERIEKMGVAAFLNQQLHPQSIDDSLVQSKLANLETLTMTPTQLAEDFPPPQKARRPELRQRRLAALQESQSAMQSGSPENAMESLRPGFHYFGPKPAPGSMMSASAATSDGGESGAMRKPDNLPQGPRFILMQLAQEELLRAVYGQRQLQEVMVHFWMNHFNIYWPKGADRWYLTSFENHVIRPRALGNFEDLLVATAESPAMLFYLDNWMSAAPDENRETNAIRPLGFRPFGPFLGRPGRFGQLRQANAGKNKRGLNENYGRELMELHTIGLHYTQKDVTEVARCFTGWTIQRPGQGGGFFFNPRMHDYGRKVVLGYEIPAGQGMEDGLEVLHILAASPYTAQHIAYELCQRFVADTPPPDLVNRAAQTFLETRGDIRSVLRTILTSPEFYSQGAYQAKVKSPFEYVASTLRALGAETDGGVPLLQAMVQMGEPPFMYEPPSGYEDVAATWINSGALLARMNFAISLCLGRIPGTEVNWQALDAFHDAGSPHIMMHDLAQSLMGGDLSPRTESAILDKLSNSDPQEWGEFQPGQETRMLASLVIASPEFQRR
ncbi:MAG TPA: DUF1800 domain-containing protein [Terriglobia bacterium]|nr:DUF1800 domain-containing protein [Terriglobia bacterium]